MIDEALNPESIQRTHPHVRIEKGIRISCGGMNGHPGVICPVYKAVAGKGVGEWANRIR